MFKHILIALAVAGTLVPISVVAQTKAETKAMEVAPSQSGSCGAPASQVRDFSGGNIDASTISAAIQAQVNMTPGELQYIRFDVSELSDIRLEAVGSGGVDPVMALLTMNGNDLASDDDSGGSGSARIEMSLRPGSYCAAVRGYSSAYGIITVQLGRLEHDPITTPEMSSGGAPACAPNVAADAVIDGLIDGAIANGETVSFLADGTISYRRFSVGSPLALQIRATGEAADPVLRIFDAEGSLVAENDDHDGRNAQIDMIDALTPGEYCVSIQALNTGAPAIEVTFSEFDEEQFLQSLYATAEATPPLGGDYPIEEVGRLGGMHTSQSLISGNARWLSFVLDTPSMVVFNAKGGSADVELHLYDDIGTKLAYDDDSGGGTDSMIARKLAAGNYMLAVSLHGHGSPNANGGAVRVIMQRYVPAE